MVTAMNRMLLRGLLALKGQVLTISLVLACGIMALVMLRSTLESLLVSRDSYYREQRFGDLFARLERAPDALASRLEAIPGVEGVYPRLVERAMVPFKGELEAIEGRAVSIPANEPPPLNGLHVTAGRLPSPNATHEVLVLAQFAKARGLSVGDRLPVVLNGELFALEIVGFAMSPEYVFAVGDRSGVADVRRFVVLWMPRNHLASIFKMEGAFNDVVFRLQPGASTPAVLDAIDRELDAYGGFHAVARDKQTSSYMLDNELKQLGSIAFSIPLVFLAVAAFLVSIVLSRLVFLERAQIAILKALGRSNVRIGLHYLGVVAAIVALGSLLGLVSGVLAGRWMLNLYSELFCFPSSEFRLSPSLVFVSVTFGFVAAAGGAMYSVARVVKLPPAEAMRPPSPPAFRRTFLSRLGVDRWVGPSATMIARGIFRNPLRFLFSTTGIAMGVGIYVMGLFNWDSFTHLMYEIYPREHREHLSVMFNSEAPARTVRELEHLPGVVLAEGVRRVGVRFTSGTVRRDAVIIALDHPSELRRLFDHLTVELSLSEDGVIMTEELAALLGVRPGDRVDAEIMEGDFALREVPIAGTIHEPFGMQAYATRRWLDHFLGESPRINGVLLRIDPLFEPDIRARLQQMPMVGAVVSSAAMVDSFEAQTGDWLSVMAFILGLSAAAIAVGVVYNNARIALSMRSRDLASLRVLGFRRKEISAMLLGELALQVVLGVPLGLLFGRLWAQFQASSVDAEMMRFPLFIADSTYATAAAIAIAAGVLSALFVRRKLDSLDLIAVLKASE